MSYLLEFNRFLFKQGKNYVLIQKIQTMDDKESKRFECHTFQSAAQYWDFVGICLAETQDFTRQRAVGWTDKETFSALEYVHIYESKYRNAYPFSRLFEKFKVFANGVQLTSNEQITEIISKQLPITVEVANYFTAKGAV